MFLWCAVLAGAAAAASSALAEVISDSALQQISALQAEKDSRTPAQQKMDSQLIFALKQSLNQVIAPGVTNLRSLVQLESDGRVKVDLKATVTQGLLDFIQTSSGSILSSVPEEQAVRALVPLSLTETLAGRADVQFVQAAVPYRTRTGSVDSEGDTTHRAAQARQAFGASGFGVKVGVLSDSVDYMSQAVSTGDLPPNVTVLAGQSGVPGSGEGTAMLEIVYDLAPGAQLFFATGDGGPANFAQNIRNLRAAGCDIIVDDIGYFNESPFQDAVIARAVNSVTAAGALYFSAAGNEGSLTHGTSGTWEGDFLDGGPAGPPVNGKGGTLHSFGTNTYDSVTGLGMATILLWSDPLGASTNDYDLYTLDSTGATVVSASTTVQNGAQDPFEIVAPPDVGERVVVVRASGDARFLHIDTIRGQLAINTAGNITGHATATNAFACAAVDIHTAYPSPFTGGRANPVESFSSDGPRRVFYNVNGTPITPGNFSSTGGYVRQKPDISAADGVATTLPSFSGLNPFYGTSAAAPHAAAIAALLKSFNPTLTSSQMRAILTSTALDIEAPGYDFNAGYGIVMAYEALQAAPQLQVPLLVLVTNIVSGGNGNGMIDFNECNFLSSFLTNVAGVTATGVRATLYTTTPGVIVAQPISTYPDMPVGGGAVVNQTPFKVSTSPSFVCGIPIDFTLVVKCDQAAFTNQFRLTTGVPGTPLRYDNSTPVPIPDLGQAESTVVVSNVNSVLSQVTAGLYITHTFDADLLLELISPDGTTCTLSANNGGSGHNYGAACGPDSLRTTFDDTAINPISAGFAPFVGSFRPQTPLSVFVGKVGTNVNGTWRLRVLDQVGIDFGILQCWSLFLTPTDCKDGGGECPGADLALGMTAQPEPVVVGNNLTYIIAVTNGGPSSAKNATVTHQLPSGVNFVSAVSSQGSCAQAGGLVTGNLGTLNPGAGATVTVVGIPSTNGTFSSTASVSSSEPDPDTSNNSATVVSHVIPASADLVAGITATPNPVLVGGTLTYTVTVTNNGPSASTNVLVGNAWPASVVVVSNSVTQGSITPGGNLWNVGSLPVGAGAVATIIAVPTQEGLITATATAQGEQPDPVPANNTATTTTIVGAAADLAISITDFPDPAVVSSNVTYVVAVTNRGPSAATSVTVNDFLPANVPVVATNASQGMFAISGPALSWDVGALASGAKATLTIVVTTTTNGVLTTSATVAGAQNDPNPTNNSATATTLVAPGGVAIEAAGATLTAESFAPPNGAIDIGEKVTVILRLRNSSNVSTLNLVGTLLTNNGVAPVPPNNPQTYGVLAPSGFPVGRAFTFTASGTNGQTISPTLQLHDGATVYPPVTFNFTLPNTRTYSNNNAIAIRDNTSALPYPSTILVSGFSGTVGRVTATVSNLTHTFAPDVDVLLVAPGGQTSMLMSGAGDNMGVVNATLTFDDAAPSPVPLDSQIYSGTYQPANYLGDNLPGPAPAGPYLAAMSMFNGANPNGSWSLFVDDHTAGDTGSIAGGWSLVFTTITPVNQLADLSVTALATPDPLIAGGTLTYTFTIGNFGPNSASSVAFTNVLPSGVSLVAASSSQGILITNAVTVLANLGAMASSATATVTVVVVVPPLAAIPSGQNSIVLTNTASVASSETDPNPVNNSVPVRTTVRRPIADLGVSLVTTPNPATAGNFNYLTNSIMVTNRGPETAVDVRVTNLLAGTSFVPELSSSGCTLFTNGSSTNVVCSLGDLGANTNVAATIVLIPRSPSATNYVYTNAGPVTNISTVYTNAYTNAYAALPWYIHATNTLNVTNAVYSYTNAGPVANISTAYEGGNYTIAFTSPPWDYTNAYAVPPWYIQATNMFLTNTVRVAAASQDTNSANDTATTSVTLISGVPRIINSGAVLTSESVPGNEMVDPGERVTVSFYLANIGSRDTTTNLTATLQSSGHVTLPSGPQHYDALIHGGGAGAQSFTFTSGAAVGQQVEATLELVDNGLDPVYKTNVSFIFYPPNTSYRTNANPISIPDHGIGLPYPSSITISTLFGLVTNATVTLQNLNHSFPHDISVLLVSPAGANVLLMSHAGGGYSVTNLTLTFDDAANNILPNSAPLTSGTYTPGSYPGPVVFFAPAPAAPYGSTLGGVNGQSPNGVWSLYVLDDTAGDAGNIAGGWSLALTTTAPLPTDLVPIPATLTGSVVSNEFVLIVTAQGGLTYSIERSTNLTSWVSLSTNLVKIDGTFKFSDPESTNVTQRYYRAKRLAP